MNKLLHQLYLLLEQEQIAYCLLRGAGTAAETTAAAHTADEIDLLVEPSAMAQLRLLLAQLGFVKLPNWGHAPHHFFVAYDAAEDGWLKLDIVTSVCYGRPIRALRTDLAQGCLLTRVRQGVLYAPATEYELVMLLLHCLLDKGGFKAAHQARLQELTGQIGNEQLLSALLKRNCASVDGGAQLLELIRHGKWEQLLKMQTGVGRQLFRRDFIGTRLRQTTSRLLRKLNSRLNFRRPSAVSVAVLAPDGAGKSTVTQGLARSFYFPVHTIYMGLYQKQAEGKGSWPARLGLAGRILRQWMRYAEARVQLAQRRLVIFDRYNYDALLASTEGAGWRQRARRWLLAHCCPAPDLVILLDAPGALLFARKGEHSPEQLERQRQQYLQLRTQIPNMAIVDATQAPEEIQRRATELIWNRYLKVRNQSKGVHNVQVKSNYSQVIN